ncbi:MAG TPA: VOC family protein [Dokdonella sp.]|uniref:VOC family protein n=1 Tax=Dokdonella sp. TaxID=2291710 RepID=UPI002C24E02C|nr:VOC family protein [Dokdonella sp.]HOX72226.1 VOC family protein [Dokdonella sp.]HPG94467.1 VOC family protein [Dokdonella sp.]HPN80710.1 VOC family protein [Dokdonella sp.]
MTQQFHAMALVVRDYDEAIAWYTTALRFDLLEDTPMGGGKRWVRVAPSGSRGACLLLARAVNEDQSSRVGNQAGGRVFLFLHTDDFERDHAHMAAHGVKFCEQPRHEEYGKVVVFEDLYGNRWDLIEPKS